MVQTDGMVTLTAELIEAGINGEGAINRLQLEILGEAWPPKKGWRDRLAGKRIQAVAYTRFLHARKRLRHLSTPGQEFLFTS